MHSVAPAAAAQSSPQEQERGDDAGLSQGSGDHGGSAGRLAGLAAARRLIAGGSFPKPVAGLGQPRVYPSLAAGAGSRRLGHL
jgi:hypothetical protein